MDVLGRRDGCAGEEGVDVLGRRDGCAGEEGWMCWGGGMDVLGRRDGCASEYALCNGVMHYDGTTLCAI